MKVIRIALAVSALVSFAVAAPDNSTTNFVSLYPPNADVIRIWEGRDVPFHPAEDGQYHEDCTTNGWCIFVSCIMEGSMIHYPASGNGPHPTVVVCPGGGYEGQAIKHEGVDVCSWLNTIGCSAFLLKYRAPNRMKGAHADAARALRIIRANAKKWNVDPNRLGIIGFSAGGHLAASVSAPTNPEPYPPVDEIDKLPFRPNFTMLVYPAYIVPWGDPGYMPGPEFTFTNGVPPSFVAQAADDPHNHSAIGWYLKTHDEAHANVELHIYYSGGHGFGVMRNGSRANVWPEDAREWLQSTIRLK